MSKIYFCTQTYQFACYRANKQKINLLKKRKKWPICLWKYQNRSWKIMICASLIMRYILKKRYKKKNFINFSSWWLQAAILKPAELLLLLWKCILVRSQRCLKTMHSSPLQYTLRVLCIHSYCLTSSLTIIHYIYPVLIKAKLSSTISYFCLWVYHWVSAR